jgi:predicted hotdog family 3-hydroxylacyl-ACP dehydratase
MEFYPAEPLIPHSRRMKLIEGVGPQEGGLQAETTVLEGWPLSQEGKVSSLIGIELVAQAISALSTWSRGAGAKAQLGLLVGVKEVDFFISYIPVGTRLRIHIKKLYHVGGYAVFEGAVDSDSNSFCKMVIQVLEPEDQVLAHLLTGTKKINGGKGMKD